mgnify:CR=1 FL=1
MNLRRIVSLVILCVSGLGACAGPIPKNLKNTVSLEADFETVIRDPAASVGKKVLWGGVILKTDTHEEYTLIEVVQKPLGFKDRPLETDQSGGRFLAEYKGQFLDPAIYKAGREITVVGEIMKSETRALGEMNYKYPYVAASFIHLWGERPKEIRVPYPTYPYYPYCRDPFWSACPDSFDYPPYFYPNPYWAYPYGLFPYNRPPFFFRHQPHKGEGQRHKATE